MPFSALTQVQEYLQDPKFMMDLERFIREDFQSGMFCNFQFEAKLKTGSTVTLDDELRVDARGGFNPHGAITYDELETREQTFVVDEAVVIAFNVKDIDDLRSVFDLEGTGKDSGMYSVQREIDLYRFNMAFERSGGADDFVDLRAGTTQDQGRLIFDALMDTTKRFGLNSVPVMGRKAIFDPCINRILRDAEKLDRATETSDRAVKMGKVGMTEGTELYESVNLRKTTEDFDVVAVNAVNPKSRQLVVTSTNKLEVGDTFTNNGIEIRVNKATPTGNANEYALRIDRDVKTLIAAGATITVTGVVGVSCPVFVGKPCHAVVQKNPEWEAHRAEFEFTTRVRSFLVHDLFVTDEYSKKIQHIDFLYRTITP